MTATAALPYEPRPRDFAMRLGRSRARSLRSARRRRHTGRRAAALLAAVAVPAMAATDDWTDHAIGWAPAEADIRPMPFETRGGSFPGSAFYYLAEGGFDAPLAPEAHSDAAARPVAPAIGPAALAMRIDNSGIDRGRALRCLTAAIYYEAASEPDSGQRAVAQVVLNRVAHPAYPATVCGVVYQGSERRTGCQFSFTCDGSLARTPHRMFWLRAEAVAHAALAGYVHAPAGLATHYHTVQIHPYWADSLAYLGTIGAHRFYRFGGAAGRLGTFRFAYAGGEPAIGAHARQAGDKEQSDAAIAVATVDPVAVQRAYDTGAELIDANLRGLGARSGVGPLARPTPEPAPSYTSDLQQRGGDALYRGDRLPDSGVRPEFEQSGRWIAQPGS